MLPPITKHVSLHGKSLCKYIARASGGANNMHPLNWGTKGNDPTGELGGKNLSPTKNKVNIKLTEDGDTKLIVMIHSIKIPFRKKMISWNPLILGDYLKQQNLTCSTT